MTEPWDNQKQEKEKRNVDKEPLVPLRNSAPPRLGALGGQATGTWHHPYLASPLPCARERLRDPAGRNHLPGLGHGQVDTEAVAVRYQLGAVEDIGLPRPS